MGLSFIWFCWYLSNLQMVNNFPVRNWQRHPTTISCTLLGVQMVPRHGLLISGIQLTIPGNLLSFLLLEVNYQQQHLMQILFLLEESQLALLPPNGWISSTKIPIQPKNRYSKFWGFVIVPKIWDGCCKCKQYCLIRSRGWKVVIALSWFIHLKKKLPGS